MNLSPVLDIALAKAPDSPAGALRRAALEALLDRLRWDAGRQWRAMADADDPAIAYGDTGAFGAVFVPDHGALDSTEVWQRETVEVLRLIKGSPTPEAAWGALFAPREDGSQVALHDLPAVCWGLIHRWEERLSTRRDEHGRLPAAASLLAREGLLHRPVVEWIARALGVACRRAPGCPTPALFGPALATRAPLAALHQRRWGLAVTFDIDSAGMYARRVATSSLARLAREGGAVAAARGLVEWPLVATGLRRDPHDTYPLIESRLRALGVRATFFAQVTRATRWDNYSLAEESRLRAELRRLHAEGHRLGLHSSHATPDRQVSFLARQRQRLARATGLSLDALAVHRAHYLRTTSPDDARRYAAAGFALDSTPGFAEHEGFRLGTALPVGVTGEDGLPRAGGLRTLPVHVMDVTLRYHRRLSPVAAFDAATRVFESARAVGGVAVLLWHPHNLEPRLWRGWEELPFELVRWAQRHGAQCGPLEDFAAWSPAA